MMGLLLESLTLGFAGSLIGLALAYGALRILVAAAPTGLPRLNEIGIDVPVLLFTLGLAVFVSLVIGMIPVIKYSGVSASTGLREGGRALSQSRERHRARKILVVVQVALALVLLICSGLMLRTFRALAHVSPGFSNPASLEAFSIYIPEAQIPDTQKERVLRTHQAIPETTQPSLAFHLSASRRLSPCRGTIPSTPSTPKIVSTKKVNSRRFAASSLSHQATSLPWAHRSSPVAT